MIGRQAYRHYEGNNYYVLGTGVFDSTGEECVLYKDVYQDKAKVRITTVKDFESNVEVDGQLVPKFKALIKK